MNFPWLSTVRERHLTFLLFKIKYLGLFPLQLRLILNISDVLKERVIEEIPLLIILSTIYINILLTTTLLLDINITHILLNIIALEWIFTTQL